mmetsp:Transcript_6241/g.17866  ORF Transcript_6241/g.17866 Transcript_6241/m.17866 type:complete len:427 (-) Transcript_6241:200-1480(-)
MLTDTEVQVLSSISLVESRSEVTTVVDVVTGGSVQVSRSRNIVRHHGGNVLDDLESTDTGGFGGISHCGDLGDHFLSRWGLISDGIFQLSGKSGVSLLPGRKSGLPFIVVGLVLLLNLREEITGSFRDVPLLTLGDTDVELGLVNVWDTGFSVSSVGTLGFFHTLSDDGVALDELGLAVVVGLGKSDGFLDGIKVVSINVEHFPSVGFISLQDVFGLGIFGHLVKSDFVGVVKDDQVVKLLVGGEAGSLGRDTFLEATVSGKGEDVVIEDLVVVGVVDGGSHLLGGSHTDSVRHTLSKRTGGGLNSGGVVLGTGEFRVSRGHGVVLTESLDLIHGNVVPGKVQPRVQEHGTVSSRKDKSVTVHPGRIGRVVGHLRSEKDGSHFSGSKGKTHVPRVGSSNRIHGKTTSLVGGRGKSGLRVSVDSSGH